MDSPWVTLVFASFQYFLLVSGQLSEIPDVPHSSAVSLSYMSASNLSLLCTATGNTTADVDGQIFNIQYEVTWFRDGVNITSSLLDVGVLEHRLENLTVDNFVDQQSYLCSVRACYESNCTLSDFSDNITSDVFTPGLQVVGEGLITVREGGARGLIQVTLTAPPELLCLIAEKEQDCKVVVMATVADHHPVTCTSTNQKTVPQILFPESTGSSQSQYCTTSVTMETWFQPTNIIFVANRDMRVESRTMSTVTLTLAVGDALTSFDPQVVMVELMDTAQNPATCISVSGSLLLSSDNQFYDLHETGEFVLFRNDIFDYEVHTFYSPCKTESLVSTCNCAAAVRVHDDVVVFYGCQAGEGITLKYFSNGNLQDGTKIYRRREGSSYEIAMATGLRVVVSESELDSLSVWVYPSPLDWNRTAGLCGNYDGDPDNDILTAEGDATTPAEFAVVWRVDSLNSLYNGLCPDKIVNLTSVSSIEAVRHCACVSLDAATCATDFGVQTCHMMKEFREAVSDNDITDYLTSIANPPLNCFDGFEQYNVFQVHEPEVDDGSWPDGWNETYARNVCEQTIQGSKIFALCDGIVQLRGEHMDNCVTNIRLSGDKKLAYNMLEVYEMLCQRELETNTTLIQSGESRRILEAICQNGCSDNGDCVGGECVCNDGFLGVDCSLSIYDKPSISRLNEDGLCNTLLGDCKTVYIFGETFVETTQLKGYYKTIEVTSQGYEETGQWTECVSTMFVSSSQLVCTLPHTGNYLIRAANIFSESADVFSDSVVLLSFNPECYTCDSSVGNCSLKVWP